MLSYNIGVCERCCFANDDVLEKRIQWLHNASSLNKHRFEQTEGDANFFRLWSLLLDFTLNRVDGFIQTDIYSKPTDNHIYLLRNSAHPAHGCQSHSLRSSYQDSKELFYR